MNYVIHCFYNIIPHKMRESTNNKKSLQSLKFETITRVVFGQMCDLYNG